MLVSDSAIRVSSHFSLSASFLQPQWLHPTTIGPCFLCFAYELSCLLFGLIQSLSSVFSRTPVGQDWPELQTC